MMWFKDKRSKIITMSSNKQEGMASIVVVSVLIIIMTLISVGFARLVSRTATNSANRQFSASATYAAQSGINDVASYLKQYVQANPGSNFLPQSTECNGTGSLIGDGGNHGPFFNDSNLSKDTNRSTQYTCILLNPAPSDLQYLQVNNLKSQVVKVNTSAATGTLDKLMVSWQPTDTSITGYPTSTSSLNDETTWNSSTGICRDAGANARCTPILRLTLYPISNSTLLSDAQTTSKTVFLYPQAPSGNVIVRSYSDNTNFKDGGIIPVPCTKTVGVNTFNPVTASDFKCNIIISDLSTAIAGIDSVYMRLTPIYNQADINISANDIFGDQLSFIGDQAIIDVTAQTGGVAKRLQARVNTSSLANNSNGVNTNISSSSDAIPEQSVRTANALCKRVVLDTPPVNFTKFIGFDDPDNVCHDNSGGNINNPVPNLAYSIIGVGVPDAGLRVCSTGDTPETNMWGCTSPNNPDPGQNPIQQGTVYIPNGGSATMNWHTNDASSCTATGGNAGDGWAGEKNTGMVFTGSPPTVGDGSQTIGGITTVTRYSLMCSRPFAPSATPTKTVTAWPPPRITGLSFSPNPVPAGSDYTVNWDSVNTRPDANGPCVKSGDWSGTVAHNGSQTFNWPLRDNTSTRTYTITCYDPIGRSDTATVTIRPGGGICTSGCCGGGCGPGNVSPPNCRADVDIRDNGDGTASWKWDGACPDYDASLGYYQLINCQTIPCGWVGNAGGWFTSGVSWNTTFCLQLEAGVDPWGWLATSARKCVTTQYPPLFVYGYVADLWNAAPPSNCPDGDTNHHWCATLAYGGSDPAGQPMACALNIGGTWEETTVGFGFVVGAKTVGWPFNPSGEGWTVTCGRLTAPGSWSVSGTM
jgi:hypothetical protein